MIAVDKLPREDKIFKIIDSFLKQVFVEDATLFIYKYLEQRYSLRQYDFSEKIAIFAKGLEDCLSSAAFAIETKILEKSILHTVHSGQSDIKENLKDTILPAK